VTDLSDWTFAGLVQYYDARSDVVRESARRFSALDAAAKDRVLAHIAATVRAYTERLHAEGYDIARTAVSVVDDLYKTVGNAQAWSPEATFYLQAVFGTFLDAASGWGFRVRYVVDNTFPDGLDRPLIFYPDGFARVGFVYVCPRVLAWDLAKHDGALTDGQTPTLDDLAYWAREGRELAWDAARQVVAAGRHLAYFEIDGEPGSFDPINALPTPPGTVEILRDAAPLPGTEVAVRIEPFVR
jgi:hypothetical protein